MLERLQSALKTVKESKPASLFPHHFVTIRRGSPAAKSGQIRAGDRLEAVEGRPVGTVPHRELSQILRRAGNSLRLTIVPRPSTYSSNLTETAEHDHGHRGRKGQRSRPKRDSRYYSVDLDRGPSGFGFSLRGGSEYNMGLYVLGLMKGGPASRSKKIQVSDQLVEINGDSTAGMTHSQAVEMIRRGGQRIHLVLKRGNGYVPDYALEHRLTSPSLLYNPRKQSVATVTSTIRRGPSAATQRRRSRSQGDERGTRMRRRRRSSAGERSVLQNPISERRARSRDDQGARRKIRSQSLPRDVTRTYDEEEEEVGTVRGRRGYEERGRSRNAERRSRSRMVESEEFEEEQRARAVEERVDRRLEERRGRVLFEESEDDIFLPIPNQTRRLPRPKENWEAESEENWGVARRYRELKRDREREDFQSDITPLHDDDDDDDDEVVNHNTRSVSFENPLPSAALADPASHRKPFSFLASSLSAEQLVDNESESEGSQSGSSVSAATVSGLSAARRVQPGPWLTPTKQRLLLEERR